MTQYAIIVYDEIIESSDDDFYSPRLTLKNHKALFFSDNINYWCESQYQPMIQWLIECHGLDVSIRRWDIATGDFVGWVPLNDQQVMAIRLKYPDLEFAKVDEGTT